MKENKMRKLIAVAVFLGLAVPAYAAEEPIAAPAAVNVTAVVATLPQAGQKALGVYAYVGDLEFFNNSPTSDYNTAIGESPTVRIDGSAGEIELGPGDSTEPDVVLSRSAANTLGLASGDTILFIDNQNLTFGTGSDATIDYDGSNLIISPAAVGSGDVSISGGSLETADSEGVRFGTGQDASIVYDGTDLLVNSQVVGSGDLIMTAGNLGLEGASVDGNEAFIAAADVGQDVTMTIPDITSGALTAGEFTTSICTGPLATGSVDTMGFIATRAYTILDIDAVWAVNESAGTVGIMPERLQGTEAIASGDDLLTGAFDGTATANTVVNGTLSATVDLSAGDRIGLDFTGDTPGELLNVCVSVRLRPN